MGKARKKRRAVVALVMVLAGLVLAWGPAAYALDPALDVSQYAHTSRRNLWANWGERYTVPA
jgi:hypothetical protein